MLDGIFRNPTEILFGKTALSGVGPRIRAFGGKALIVHGNAYTRHGAAERIRGELGRAGVEYLELGGVRPNPMADVVYQGIDLCRTHDVKVLLAVGGGSVIDTAKAIGAGTLYPGDFFDFFERKAVPSKTLPVACVVTIFGAGSESSDGAVISKQGHKYSCGNPLMYPVFSALDPTITESVPPFLLACGIFDSVCHIMERYFSPTPRVETSDELCFSLLRALFTLGPRLLDDPANYDLRANVMWASKLAHDNTVGFGRKHDWGTHTIAHEVGERCGWPHGSVLAVLYPAWMTYIQPFHPELFYKLGRGVMGIEGCSLLDTGRRAIGQVQAFARRLGLPSTLAELGLASDRQFDSIAAACCATTQSGTIGNLRRLTGDEIVNVLQIAEGARHMSMLPIINQQVDNPPGFRKDPYFETTRSKCDASRYKVFSIEDARQLFGKRDIYIWGAGQKGRGFLLALRRCGFDVKGFLDSSTQMVGTEYMGARVFHPEAVLRAPHAADNLFVLTATVDAKNKEIFASLESDYGFVRGESFDNIQALSPFYPTIEVTGLCNLKCSSCPRSDPSILEVGKYMSFADYERVIRKVVADIPFVYLVDLYVWGEPLLNPAVPDMIRLNNSLGIGSGLSTNLNNIRHLEAAMEAFPAQIRVSLSGVSKETYEVTHTGGNWERVSRNMETLSKLNEKYGNRTIVELYFHIYRHNIHELPLIIDLCKRYNFRFHPSLAILFHDFPLKLAQTGVLPESAQTATDRLVVDLQTLIEDCEKQTDKNCILTRVVPVINWDMSVMPCCTFSYSGIAKSYLDISLPELIDRRTYSTTCASCQQHALHRWNDQGFYSGFVKEIVAASVAGAPAPEYAVGVPA